MVIGCFVGQKPLALEFEAWLVSVNEELQRGSVSFSHYSGKGFFSMEADCENTQQRLLTLEPQRNLKSLCILQPWVPSLDPDKPQDLFVLTWITLRKLPKEYLVIAS